MYLDPNWRILTIGDGDLSFSNAIFNHIKPAHLTASVYDSLAELSRKYGDSFYQQLVTKNCRVITELDITKPQSWPNKLSADFDVVIFQFPLIPSFKSKAEFEANKGMDNNLLNRSLLRQFLMNSSAHFLDPNGQQLCFITSKDVKPYCEWNIEHALHRHSNIDYLGSIEFDITKFPGYRIRNVDRDKHVKDTQGTTYVWRTAAQNSQQDQSWLSKLTPAQNMSSSDCCPFCPAGPFTSEQHKLAHESSRKHQRMAFFEKKWTTLLSNEM